MTGAQLAGVPGAALRRLLLRDGRRVPPVALGLPAIALFAWWAANEGGAAPGAWYPGALLFLAALVVCARPDDLRRLPPFARRALAMLALFSAWSFLSVAWADARGDAWDGANRTLLYLTVFVLFAAVRWKPAEAAVVLAGFALATAGVGAWEVVQAIAGSDPAAFAGGRLAGPVGYENATAALLLAAFWPALLLASQRETPWPARGVLLAAASVLLDLCVLAQSRGSLVAGTTALVLALVLTRERGRLLLALSALAMTTLAALPALLSVYDAVPGEGRDALARAGLAIALSAAVLLAAGLASRYLDRPPMASLWGARSPPRWVAAAAAAVLATGGLAVTLARTDAVPGAAGAPSLDSRFTAGVESGRYDFWRVAARQFVRHPLQGAGADNFAHDYARERRRGEEPLYPHSIMLGAFGQTGIVGGALLIGFLATACAGVLRPGRGRAREPVAVAALVCAAAWLVHATIDWLWELPALAAPAMACLGLIAGLSVTAGAHSGPALRRVRLGRAAAAAVAIVAAASYALPALAAHEIERAVLRVGTDPAAALRGLERARSLNPLSDRADVIGGALALEAGDLPRARRSFQRALARDAQNWYPEAVLAVIDLREGRRTAALARLSRARRMNPLEPAIAAAMSAGRRGVPAPPEVQARLSRLTVPGPLGRRPVGCRPVLGLAAACARSAGA
jgi:O-antigen ligase